jgi:hypothetical protein
MMPKPDPEKHQHATNPDLLQKALYQLLEQISKRDQKLVEKEAQLLYVQAQLIEKEAQLHEIVTSKVWKIMLFVQKARRFLGSPQSRRAQMLRRGLEIISSSFKKTGRN